ARRDLAANWSARGSPRHGSFPHVDADGRGTDLRAAIMQPPMQPLRRMGYLALLVGFAQVVFGAIVRITGSGLGCGDHWPDCFGSFTPAHNAPSLLVEISHRYGAAALSIAIVALLVVAWRKRSERGVNGR